MSLDIGMLSIINEINTETLLYIIKFINTQQNDDLT